MASLADPPLQTSLVIPPDDPNRPDATWQITKVWNDWLRSLTTRLQLSPSVFTPVVLTGQTTSLSPTAIPLGTIAAGRYRISWHVRITTAATTSSSLTVSIGYTTSGIACTQSGSAVTGNTTSTVQSGVILVKVDQATAITYSTTYASVGGTVMVYQIDVTCEFVI